MPRPSVTAAIVGTLASAGLGGCATQPDKIQAGSVSSINYGSYDCQRIAMESRRVQERASALHHSLKGEADADEWQMGLGLVLFWPSLFFLEGGDGPQAAEYAQLKGEAEALQKAAVEKRCQSGPAVAASATSPSSTPTKATTVR